MLDNGTLEQREAYMSYQRGWVDGAGHKADRREFTSHPKPHIRNAYTDGYREGFTARGRAMTSYARKHGYSPSILRDNPTAPTGSARGEEEP